MNKQTWNGLVAAVAMALSSAGLAAPINPGVYGAIGPNLVDFEDVVGGAFPGVNYDGILVTGGVSIAERFVGQTLSFSGDLDVLSGVPSGPLTLMTGAAGQNVAVGTDTGTNGLYPYGPDGFPSPSGYGEGAFAVLFPGLVSEFGFESFFGGGSMTFLDFFASDGSLIGSATAAGIGSFGFTREGGVHDIAGVSVYTNDPGGLGYDNFRYDDVVNEVPEPTTLVLLGLGLLGIRLRFH